MRHTFRILIYLWTLSSIPGAFAGEVDGSAVIGGAVGGGLGAAAGSYVGGREGAIVGSAVGAAAGTAIATHDYGGEDLKRNESSDHDIVYVTSDRKTTGKKGKGCPPGLRMQGRC